MTQDERWTVRYNEVMEFMQKEHRKSSRHDPEEHDMLNWVKSNRKHLNTGTLKAERQDPFKELLLLVEQFKRKNQWV